MEAYSTRIAEIQQELMERKGINVTRVIMTSDEQDESWWDRVREMGWLRIDHEKENTIIEYGEWYVLFIYTLPMVWGFWYASTHGLIDVLGILCLSMHISSRRAWGSLGRTGLRFRLLRRDE